MARDTGKIIGGTCRFKDIKRVGKRCVCKTTKGMLRFVKKQVCN